MHDISVYWKVIPSLCILQLAVRWLLNVGTDLSEESYYFPVKCLSF